MGYVNNSVFLVDENGIKHKVNPNGIKNLKIKFRGQFNTIEISKNAKFSHTNIRLGSNNAKIKLGSGRYNNVYIFASEGDNQSLEIGDDFSCYGAAFHLKEDCAEVKIGKNCMLSGGINFWATDGHAIVQNGEAINEAKPIIIGNHVWIGADVRLCKGSKVADNSIAGLGAVIAGKFDEPNVVIAGNPAKIVKHDVNWDRKTACKYNQMAKAGTESKEKALAGLTAIILCLALMTTAPAAAENQTLQTGSQSAENQTFTAEHRPISAENQSTGSQTGENQAAKSKTGPNPYAGYSFGNFSATDFTTPFTVPFSSGFSGQIPMNKQEISPEDKEKMRNARETLKQKKISFSSEEFVKQIKKNKIENVKLMLDAGMSPNADYYGEYALYYAAKNNKTEIALLLLEKGANPNTGFDSPVFWAVKNNNYPLAKTLLEKGAKADYTDLVSSKTTLYTALKKNRIELAKLLIEHGAKIDSSSAYIIEKKDLYSKLGIERF